MISSGSAYWKLFYTPLNNMGEEVQNLINQLKSLRSRVNSFNDVHGFYVEHFEDVNDVCLRCGAVCFIWNDFRKSLVRYKTAETEEIYSIADAAEYFSYRNFTREMNISFWNGYGGMFTGLGILGTFVGLTIGLNNIDMSSSDIDVLKNGIASLLSGVQSAFITSLLGIGAAIAYSLWHNSHVNKFQRHIKELASLIEEMFPRRTAEEWLHRNYVESEEQTKALKNIGTDVADALYEGFDEHFNEGIERLCDQIEEKIAPFFEGIQTAINNLNVGFGDAVGRVMSEQAGSQMQRFAQSLDSFAQGLQQAMISSQKFGAEMNEDILSTLEDMRRTLRAGAEENANQMKLTTELFQSIVDKHTETMTQYHNKLFELETSTENVLAQIKESTSTIGQIVEPLQQSAVLLKVCLEQIARATRQFHDEISDQITSLIKANQQTQNNIGTLITGLREYEQHVEQAWQNCESNFNRIGGELENATDIITDRLNKYNEMMNGSMSKTLTDFDKSMSGAVGLLQSLVEDLQDAADDLQQKRRFD